MNDCCFLFIIASLHTVQCLIPNLVVKKLDRTLIARKRQDTMDMCRLFTEENKKTEHNHVPKIINSYRLEKYNQPKDNHRYKRDVNIESPENHRYKKSASMKYAVNPALDPEDAKRVENIVDKLYDDMEEKGQRVTYRQVRTTSSFKVNRNKTFKPSRRFEFAPAKLTGPHAFVKKSNIEPDDRPFLSKARWKHGIVPYYIDFKTYDTHLSEVIVIAFDYIEKVTCIRLQKLRERPTDKKSLETVPWLYISNPTGIRQCVHSNEKIRVNGVLMIVFGYDCMTLGDIIHEVMHILGYSHEHLRSDRDQYISILWENIKPGYKKYFDLKTYESEYELESLPYDYSSILHYPPRAFSKNGQVTIMTEQGIKFGQRLGLSVIDVEKVALIYSNECVSRNREYLLQTCPSVVKSVTKPANITQKEIDNYFKERLWPFGIITFKFRDKMEFTVEERDNINTVFRHIEQETCLQFRDVGVYSDDDDDNDDEGDSHQDQKAIIAEKEEEAEKKASAQAREPEYGDDRPESEVEKPASEFDKPETEVDKPKMEVDKPESEVENPESEVNKPESEVENPESEDNKPESDFENPESEVKKSESEVEKLELEIDKPQTDSENPVLETNTPDPAAEKNESDAPIIAVGPVAPAQASDKNDIDSYDDSKIGKITIPKFYNSERRGLKEPVIVTGYKKDIKENEIQKNNIESALNNEMLRPAEIDFKNMNLTMKKALLKRAAARKKQQGKRKRRDTSSVSPRRHANAVLVLKRSANPGCPCPEAGTPKRDQVLDIGAGCFNSVNDLLHFFVHVLGLDHQHNMHDRDNYLHIVWANLTADVRQEMENKLPPAASVGFSYDYQSVMHYPWLQIKSGKTNIMYPIWNDGWAMGHWQGLSSIDVQKLNLLYFSQCMERQQQEKQ